jgi:hypothetical protein
VKKHDFGGSQVRGARDWCGFAATAINPAITTATQNHNARIVWLRFWADFTPRLMPDPRWANHSTNVTQVLLTAGNP